MQCSKSGPLNQRSPIHNAWARFSSSNVPVIDPIPPVHVWLLTSPLPFHLRHVRHIPSQISFPLSKTDKSLTNTSNSRNKTNPHVLYVFVNKLSSEVSQSYECIQKYIIAYSNIFSTYV